MKRFFRSKLTKSVAFVLILVCAALFVAIVADMLDFYDRGRLLPYGFESSFEESRALRQVQGALIEAVYKESPEAAAEYLDEYDYAKYYIETDGMPVYGSGAIEEVKSCPWWFKVKKETEALEREAEYTESGDNWHSIYSDWSAPFTVYAGINEEKYLELVKHWYSTKRQIMNDAYIAGGIVLLALILCIYLLIVCGRRKDDDEAHTLLIDRLYVEILVIPAAIAVTFLICLSVTSLDTMNSGIDAGIMIPISMIAAVLASGIFVCTAQSVVRNIKNGTFVSRLLCLKILKWIWKTCGRLAREIKRGFIFLCGDRIRAVILVLFAVYSFLIVVFIGMRSLFIPFVIFLAAAYFLYRYLEQLDKIKTGIFRIRNGETDYKIEGCTTELLANAADALNSINEGVKISVEREVAAQRMKSELITNVSHDLKTPLTSIISYADLLTGMELLPKEANDYARIIKQKGDRLKKLTNDLFDISKAESGDETVSMERLDIALLLRQSLAELNSEIEKSGLNFVSAIPEKEIFVNADGKKLSRVFENLLVNALKYSMKGTRVYVGITETGGEATAYIKNISSAPMNFDSSEITERFVRGDASRTTEGSGLGLAIAKSYTELCGGRLEIDVDGDLFKATVRLKSAL